MLTCSGTGWTQGGFTECLCCGGKGRRSIAQLDESVLVDEITEGVERALGGEA